MEWLSVFVEDCFSSPPSCVLVPNNSSVVENTNTISKPSETTTLKKRSSQNESPFAVPGKARSKRKRLSAPRKPKDPFTLWSNNFNQQNDAFNSDPPLLKQTYWLADSELIVTKKNEDEKEVVVEDESKKENESEEEINNGQHQVTRRCSHCLSQRTPQWRAGPMGPKTLCNACGVRYKSGRLHPEYRPAKSPTFVSYLHSNSHKKVMEMRMSSTPTPTPSEKKK